MGSVMKLPRLLNIARKLNIKYGQKIARCNSSSAQNNIIVETDSVTGIAIMRLNRKPANCFDLEFSQQLINELQTLESNSQCEALIITSNLPGIFSGGLDFKELYKPEREKFLKFTTTFNQFWSNLYASPLATVAAINGASPAGGCLIAIACDYRIMTSQKGKIGLNEVEVGIPIRHWIYKPYSVVVGSRQAELALMRAQLFTPQEALSVGLIDDIALNDVELLKKAKDTAKSFVEMPREARRQSKMIMRQPVIDEICTHRAKGLQDFVDSICGDQMQATFETYTQKLKSRKKS